MKAKTKGKEKDPVLDIIIHAKLTDWRFLAVWLLFVFMFFLYDFVVHGFFFHEEINLRWEIVDNSIGALFAVLGIRFTVRFIKRWT